VTLRASAVVKAIDLMGRRAAEAMVKEWLGKKDTQKKGRDCCFNGCAADEVIQLISETEIQGQHWAEARWLWLLSSDGSRATWPNMDFLILFCSIDHFSLTSKSF